MSEKTKKGLRFNIIDIVILLIVIGCIVGIVLRLGVKKSQTNISSSNNAMRYVMYFPSQPDTLNFAFKEGDMLYDNADGAPIGVVHSVSEPEEAWTVIENEDGKMIRVKNAGYNSYKVEVDANVLERADGFYIDGKTLCCAGVTIRATTAEYSADGMILSLEPITEVTE